MNKDDLVDLIKEWISIDNEMKELQRATKEKRERKKELTNNLVEVMKTNEIDCFDVNEGKLVYTKTKTRESLSKKYLLSTLGTFFKDDPTKAQQLTEFLLENRQEKVKENIRRK